ncbi:uncharacterized protein LOC100823020 [Brachypodium distachyon]|uniref:Uncharacterized protein n=1 Tax=Brachypodium distachyon TaxID=15368 RepID=A0A2K2DQC5_BRADI|nr:uncharacterized protein LOC100823020 [Brachypodium distachyon]PNT76471.1 hypothetical protein BRADI_1g48560v3 [Brachypodium distachyon]|eukprot:XP_003561057.1 uncharacterized protein LOC100823020 [Brachypodium distachyon]
MDYFPDRQHVRLRSLELGTYLHAAADGIEVGLHTDRASVTAAWTVHRYQNEHDNTYLLLHSAASGRYLAAATNTRAPRGQSGFRVEQREFDEPEVASIMWQVIRPGNFVLLRHVGANFLRANGRRRFSWNSGVTVDKFQNMSTMMHWVVEPIPALQAYPGVPAPIAEPLSSPQFTCILFGRDPPPVRAIRFQRANDDGTFNEDGWREFQFTGSSSYRLLYELIIRLDIVNFVMCVRAGRYARLTPLLSNLPSGTGNTLYIVAIHNMTPGADELRFPDMGAA